jgi:hypothetical protein
MTERDAKMMLELAFKLSCNAQFALATKIAANVGYVLVGEPAFDDTRAAAPVAVEVWNGERKVTVYDDIVLRVWGPNMEDEMSEEPRSHETVGAAFKWLFDAAAPIAVTPERPKVIGRVTGTVYDGDQVAGMPGAICHACGLQDYPCVNPDCPNKASL